MRLFPINSIENKRRALRAVNAIMGADGEEVVIRKITSSGTTQQLAWFNMLCKMIAEEIGDDVESVKGRVKVDCFGWQDGELDGIQFQYIPRSTLHGKPGVSQLIDHCYKLGGDLGIILPDPDPNWARNKRRESAND